MITARGGAPSFTNAKQAEGSDDFGFYSEKVPSIYFWVGSRHEDAGNTSLVDTPTFLVSDSLLKPATEVMVSYCLSLLTDPIDLKAAAYERGGHRPTMPTVSNPDCEVRKDRLKVRANS